LEKVSAFMSLPSFSLYMLSLNFIKELLDENEKRRVVAYKVWTSVPNPEIPMRH
jgi:hypothetical protein